MKLTINGLCVNPVLGSLQLEKRLEDAAAALTATLWTAAADTYFLHISLAVGDVVRLTEDDGTERFLGSIHALERTPEQVRITAFDRSVFLGCNEVWGVFAGSGAEICRQIAGQLDIPTGELEAEETYRVLSVPSGQRAFPLLRQAAGAGREIAVENGLLTVRRSRPITFLLLTEQIRKLSAAADIRNLVNCCVVVDRKGRTLAQAENTAQIAAWGRFRTVQSKNGDPYAQARSALRGRFLAAEVLLDGNAGYVCGALVRGQQPQWGLDGLYRITAVCHRWEGGIFTTELTLEGTE